MRLKAAGLATFLMATAVLRAQTTNFIESPAVVTFNLSLKSQIPGTFVLDAQGKIVIDPVTKKPVEAYGNTKVSTNSIGDPTKEESLYAGKIASRRYGNAELLRDLLAAGELGQAETNTTGWGIFSTSRGEEGNGETTLVARKVSRVDGQSITNDVVLDGILNLTIVPVVSRFSFSETVAYTYNAAGDQTAQVMTGRGLFADEGIAFLEFAGLTAEAIQNPVPAISAAGYMSEIGSEYRWYPTSDKSLQGSILISSGVNIIGIVGNSEPPEGESGVLMTGSVSLGRTTAVRDPGN